MTIDPMVLNVYNVESAIKREGKQGDVRTMKQDGEWLTVEDIAADLKVHPETVRNWIRNGELAAIVVSKRTYRINKNDYLEFIRTHRIQKNEKE